MSRAEEHGFKQKVKTFRALLRALGKPLIRIFCLTWGTAQRAHLAFGPALPLRKGRSQQDYVLCSAGAHSPTSRQKESPIPSHLPLTTDTTNNDGLRMDPSLSCSLSSTHVKVPTSSPRGEASELEQGCHLRAHGVKEG